MSHRFIRTFSGEVFNYDLPKTWENAIRIDDIAHSLGNICRFTGHSREFYSVAEHSVLGTYAPDIPDAMHAMAFLLHDAHEAYLGDINTPLKSYLWDTTGALDALAISVDTAIHKKFKLDVDRINWDIIKTVDRRMLETEANQLLVDWKYSLPPYNMKLSLYYPRKASEAFLKRYHELKRAIDGSRSNE